jgi:hypothetical protein
MAGARTQTRYSAGSTESPGPLRYANLGRRAGTLEEVRFTDIEHLEFDL